MRPRNLRDVLIVVLTAASVFAQESRAAGRDKVIARVNEAKILAGQLAVAVNKKLPLASFHSRVSLEKQKQIKVQALQALIDEELLYQEAKRRNLAIDRDAISRQIEQMKSGFPNTESFARALQQTGLTPERLGQRMERQQLIRQILQLEVDGKIHVDESAVRAYYDTHREKFKLPPQFKVRHLLISVDPGAMSAGWQAGLEKAEGIYEHLRRGENFAALARAVSDDTTSNQQGGDIGWFHKGQLLPELEASLDTLEISETSRPIRTIYGYHLIKLEGVRAAKQLGFEEIDRESLQKKLRVRQARERKAALLARLRALAKIQILDY